MSEEFNPIEDRKNSKKQGGVVSIKLLFATLGALLILLILFIWKSNEYKNSEAYLEEQKVLITNELESLKIDYDTLKIRDQSLEMEVSQARARINGMLDSLSRFKTTLSQLRSIQSEVAKLRAENKNLYRIADSLNRANVSLKEQRDMAEDSLKRVSLTNDSLSVENSRMQQNIASASSIDARSITVEPINVAKNGKIVPAKKIKRANQIKVSFILAKNVLATSGEKEVYVSLSSPLKLIGAEQTNNFITIEGVDVRYSTMKQVLYDNRDVDVSVFINGLAGDFVPGRYKVFIYMDGREIGQSQVLLN